MAKEYTKLTDEVHTILVEAFEKGLPKVVACRLAGIHRNTLMLWLKNGESKKSGKYRELYDAIEEARTTFWEAKQSELEQVVYRQATQREKTVNMKITRVMKLSADDQLFLQEQLEQSESMKQRFEQEGILYKQEVTIKEHLPDAALALEVLARRSPEEWGRYETLKLEMDIRKELEALGLGDINPDDVIAGAVAAMEQMIESKGDETPAISGKSGGE